jgi:hypothetical protein
MIRLMHTTGISVYNQRLESKALGSSKPIIQVVAANAHNIIIRNAQILEFDKHDSVGVHVLLEFTCPRTDNTSACHHHHSSNGSHPTDKHLDI